MGKAWSATLTVRPAQKAAPTVAARLGQRAKSFATRALGHGRYRVRLVFPASGTWKLAARLSGGARALRPVTVRKDEDKGGKSEGAVYTLTNDFGQNAVVVFDRHSNGLIVQKAVVPTGGKGGGIPQHGCTDVCPFLDNQAPLVLSDDGKLLFAVNPGSNTISSFKVKKDGLTLVGQVNSGGPFPYSVTVHDDLLYVVNVGGPTNIAGFRFSGDGKLTPIPGSQKPVPGAIVGLGAPRQIGFDNTGKVLAVTLLGAPDGTGAVIDTFLVDKKGVAGNAIPNPSTSPLPFGFSWDAHNHLFVSAVHDLVGTATGVASTYSINTSTGHLTPIETKGTLGFGACWTDVSSDGKYAYVVNTGAGNEGGTTVSVFKVSPSGGLALTQVTPQVVVFPFPPPGTPEFARTDIALSPDDDFAYVVVPGIFSPTTHIDTYSVGDDGSLTLLNLSPSTLAGGLSGLVTG